MVCICMQAVMIEKVFYSIPHHMGYFKLKKEEHEIRLAEKSNVDDNFTSALKNNSQLNCSDAEKNSVDENFTKS